MNLSELRDFSGDEFDPHFHSLSCGLWIWSIPPSKGCFDLVVLALKTFLFIKVVTAEEALRAQLGSATLVLWTVFYAMAVITSFFGARTLIRTPSPYSTLNCHLP